MKDIILVGGGGHCKSVIDVIETENKYNIKGIIDMPENIGQEVLGYKVIGCDADLSEIRKTVECAVITVGQIKSADIRIKLFERLKREGFILPVIASPLAHASAHAVVGEGTVIMHYALVNASATVGVNCIINNRAQVEHDAAIGDHCHISTAAVVNGGSKVGSRSFIGSGAVVVNGVHVPEQSFLKAGSLYK